MTASPVCAPKPKVPSIPMQMTAQKAIDARLPGGRRSTVPMPSTSNNLADRKPSPMAAVGRFGGRTLPFASRLVPRLERDVVSRVKASPPLHRSFISGDGARGNRCTSSSLSPPPSPTVSSRTVPGFVRAPSYRDIRGTVVGKVSHENGGHLQGMRRGGVVDMAVSRLE